VDDSVHVPAGSPSLSIYGCGGMLVGRGRGLWMQRHASGEGRMWQRGGRVGLWWEMAAARDTRGNGGDGTNTGWWDLGRMSWRAED
jgi:hypothetical protein